MPQFKLPDPGEGLVEAEIVTWRVQPGDTVKVNDIVVEVETAKSLVELPIPWAGTVRELLVPEGETVEVGSAIIDIDTGEGDGPNGAAPSGVAADGDGVDAATAPPVSPGTLATPGETAPPQREAVLVGYGASEGSTTRRRRKGAGQAADDGMADEESLAQDAPPEPARALAKPPVRKYAKDKGVALSTVTPTREDGVITRADVDTALAAATATPLAAATPTPPDAPTGDGPTPPDAPTGDGPTPPDAPTGAAPYQPPRLDRTGERETRTPVKGVRKMTAQAMTGSAFVAPHVTEFITVDVSATMELVERLKADREFSDLKVNPMLVVAKAVVLAARRNPGIVAVWEDGADGESATIVQRHYVNLGIAAATPRGLIVPNIKDADLMDLRQLAEAMGDLVATARSGRTQPAQMSGGTITITNVGVFGVDTGTPIINPGESAIVCFGAVRRQPWVVTAADGSEQIVPRWVTQLAVSFDHRLIDGELGSRFLADVAAILHDPSRGLVWG